MEEKNIIRVKDLTFDKVKDSIIYVLTRKNEELASCVPYVNYLDLIKFIKGSQYYFSGHLWENTLYFTQESHPPVTPRVL